MDALLATYESRVRYSLIQSHYFIYNLGVCTVEGSDRETRGGDSWAISGRIHG